jgi:hypothetical protein
MGQALDGQNVAHHTNQPNLKGRPTAHRLSLPGIPIDHVASQTMCVGFAPHDLLDGH